MNDDATCPTCGEQVLEPHEHVGGGVADDEKAPWHFKLMVAALVVLQQREGREGWQIEAVLEDEHCLDSSVCERERVGEQLRGSRGVHGSP